MYGFNGGFGGVPVGLQPGYAMPTSPTSSGTATAPATPPPGGTPAPTYFAPQTPQTVAEYARQNAGGPGLAQNRANFEGQKYANLPADGKETNKEVLNALRNAKDKRDAYDQARQALAQRQQGDVQAGKLGVDLSVQTNNMRNQTQMEFRALRCVNGRNCLELGGVWIDDGFDPKMPVVTIKAQSDAYFDLLARQPKLKEVFQLGNHLVWVTPSGTALIVDTNDGKDKLSKEDIDKLFVAKK
jgi:Ca-activated chloride channel family protein